MSAINTNPNINNDFESDEPTPTGTAPPPHLRRTVSGATPSSQPQWSPAATPQHHHHGTSYFPSSTSLTTPRQPPQHPHPILRTTSGMSSPSRRRDHRSTSLSSSAHSQRSLRRDDSRSTISREDAGDDDDVPSEGDDEEDMNSQEEENDTASQRRGKKKKKSDDDGTSSESSEDEDPITLKDRQSLINVEHPFGLPIWKPALYKKSRSVTRYADEALHSVPSAQAEKHLLPGNILWVVLFGWWLALACFAVSAVLWIIPAKETHYSNLAFGLGWYIAWPFGKYVEGLALDENGNPLPDDEEANVDHPPTSPGRLRERTISEGSDTNTVRGIPSLAAAVNQAENQAQHGQSVSWSSVVAPAPGESTSLLSSIHSRTGTVAPPPLKSYGALCPLSSSATASKESHPQTWADTLSKAFFWLLFIMIIAPLMLVACLLCWAFVVTIPMARLNWALIKHIWSQPTTLRFCAAPLAIVVPSTAASQQTADAANATADTSINTAPRQLFTLKHQRLSIGQTAPFSSNPTSTVLLCTYRATGLKYYKYTVGGVNILFINLLPLVFFAIFDGLVLLPYAERLEHHGKEIPALLEVVASPALIFLLSLLSVIPLSYFIGMAVASISAQSSIGMGAVINATFGSLIEIILYSLALADGKGRLVEGSIVGSLLAGVLLMPGLSMISGALRRKEMRFNAKSAGVTSVMLIMAIIGTLAPTLFYQTYGNFSLVCTGCPSSHIDNGTSPNLGFLNILAGGHHEPTNAPWVCDHCSYEHPDPGQDPFFQSTVKQLMYFCASILVFSYLIGLWFSLRTHASQIWQNPQQLMYPMDLPVHHGMSRPMSLYQRLASSQGHPDRVGSGHGQPQGGIRRQPSSKFAAGDWSVHTAQSSTHSQSLAPPSPGVHRRVSYAPPPPQVQQSHLQPDRKSVV